MKNPEIILENIKSVTTKIIGDNLTGIYVHGSYAFGCFNWDKSDIDYLAVIKNPMTIDEKIKYISEILKINETAPPKGIEMSIVLEKYCKNFIYPTPYELHFSNDHLSFAKGNTKSYCESMHGTDPDLAAHFTVTRTVGITLFGKEINEVFSDVPKENYLDSIKYDVENCLEDIFENPIYVILNLCRVLSYIKDGLVLSKAQGGEWGIENLPKKYNSIIKTALSCYLSDYEYPVNEYKNELENFAKDMLGLIFIQ